MAGYLHVHVAFAFAFRLFVWRGLLWAARGSRTEGACLLVLVLKLRIEFLRTPTTKQIRSVLDVGWGSLAGQIHSRHVHRC